MRTNFSLSFSKEKVFPVKLSNDDGEYFPIDANFRTVLKILRLQEDSEVLESQKMILTLKWFYPEAQPSAPYEALSMMYKFIRRNSGEETGETQRSGPQFDYEFDSEEIYTSFLRDYNIDLYEVDFLHWYKFQMILMNLSPESPFSQKIKLRFIDLKGVKGENYLKLSRARRKVQIPVKYTPEEERLLAEMRKKLR